MSNDFADHAQRTEEAPQTVTLAELRTNPDRVMALARRPGGVEVIGEGGHAFRLSVPSEPLEDEEAPQTEDPKDAVRMVVQNARSFERELIIAKLRAEMFNASEAHEADLVASYKMGWNQRAKSIIESLGGTVEDV